MSELFGTMTALSAIRLAGQAVVRSVQSLKPEGGAHNFAEELSGGNAKLEVSKATEGKGADSQVFAERLLSWLSSLGLPANEILQFSLDSTGSPVLDHPPGNVVATDIRLRENEVLRQQLADQIRNQPGGTLSIPMK